MAKKTGKYPSYVEPKALDSALASATGTFISSSG